MFGVESSDGGIEKKRKHHKSSESPVEKVRKRKSSKNSEYQQCNGAPKEPENIEENEPENIEESFFIVGKKSKHKRKSLESSFENVEKRKSLETDGYQKYNEDIRELENTEEDEPENIEERELENDEENNDSFIEIEKKSKLHKQKLFESLLEKVEQRKLLKLSRNQQHNEDQKEPKNIEEKEPENIEEREQEIIVETVHKNIAETTENFHGIEKKVKHQKRKALESLLEKAKKRKLIKTGGPQLGKEEQKESATTQEKKESFTILGRYSTVRNTKVQHHLPGWLGSPNQISADIESEQCLLEEMKHFLSEQLLDNLKSNDVSVFFPVQKAVIPWLVSDISKFGLSNSTIMRPRDLCVSAPTGSGKTLTYVLPIIQSLQKRLVPKIRALVVVPVQELAIQVTNVFRIYCKGTDLKVEAATGKTPLNIEQSKLIKGYDLCDYESLVDILVTTPGRLVEHLENTKGFDLSYLRYLVMDEADRMIDNIQNNWLYHLDKHVNLKGHKSFSQLSLRDLNQRKKYPQKLLFSATLSQDPELLKKLNLFQPILFATMSQNNNSDKTEDYIGSFTTPSTLKEKFIIVEPTLKPLVLCELLKSTKKNMLCFTKSAVEAHKLSKLLSLMNPKIEVSEISSLLPADQREKILSNFSSGLVNVLVCSDVMARGVDISGVKYVVSYDPPKHIKSYIHRVGRTGRAGMKGKAITLLSPTQAPLFNQMLQDVNKNDVKQMAVDEQNVKGMMSKYKTALQELKGLLQKEESVRSQEMRKVKSFTSKKKKTKRKKQKKKV
ncbi:ATP-dependent RNA helicase DDX51 [Halyomorpha halys]|uniref:ATP-dependent RNA helicase DDX51 n=1 Tax=Halyomorpha halys TaxID=286706 RepID=UPI0006D4FFEF